VLRAILDFSLRRRSAVIALACALGLYGGWIAEHAELDVFPDFVPPQVVVQTEAPGLAPEQVEQLVTLPIEVASSGLGQLESLRSESIQGLSILTAVFAEDADVLAARQLLAERLSEASSQLPIGVQPPRMSPLTSSTMDVLKIGLVSSALSPMELRTLADWTVRPRLLMVPGVARVNVFGGEIRELQIEVRPERLHAHGLNLLDVVAAAREASAVRGAGFVDTRNQRIALETRGEASSPAALGASLVTGAGGAPVRLSDLAAVREAPAPAFGDALIQGRAGVLLTISSQHGANTMAVTRALERALDELGPLLQREQVTLVPRLHRPATFIEAALRNLRFSLLLGGALVVAVLVLFLRDLRTAFISLTAIPLSLLSAVLVLDRIGITLNTMTLGGLAIAIGEVVDDAIIDVENIVRRLRENGSGGRPRAALAVVLDASLEVRSAVVHATLSVVLVFLPLLMLSGLQGRFFAPLAASYLLAVLASLGVALSVTPALSLALLGRGLLHEREPRLQTALKGAYRRVLGRVSARPAPVLAGVSIACLASIAVLPFLGGEFLPAFREHHLVLQVSTAPGASLEEMLRVGRGISKVLLGLPGVETVEQQAGRAEQGEDTWGPSRSEFHVELRPTGGAAERETTEQIRSLLDAVPGIQSEVLTFLGDRIGETITGETAEVVVNVFGDDLEVLDAKAREIAAALEEVRGAVDVQVPSAASGPRVGVLLRRDRLLRLGFRPLEVLDQVQVAYAGAVVAQTHRGNQVTDVRVLLEPGRRRDPGAVGSLLVSNARGTRLPLRALADVAATSGRDSISHEGGRRRQTITCNVSGRDVASFVAEAEPLVRQRVSLPGDTHLVFGGTAQARSAAQRELLLHSAIGGLGIVLLLSTVAGSWRNLLLLLANLPLALVGGVLAVSADTWLGRGEGVSLGSLVGFVTLFGITLRNSIMLVSHLHHLLDVEGASWSWETVVRAASERAIPIAMTALVTGLGLLPLALGADRAGGEIDGPMATVILGGLLSSTTLNLLVLPILCYRAGRFGRSSAPATSSSTRLA
jgi:CzcA family heavy metal efflux pump